jgi:alpha-amylase/alpha-mannosidase (GH57 family)
MRLLFVFVMLYVQMQLHLALNNMKGVCRSVPEAHSYVRCFHYTGYTQNNGAVSIDISIETALFFYVYSVHVWPGVSAELSRPAGFYNHIYSQWPR